MRFWSVFYFLFFGFGCLLDIQEPAGSNQALPTAADVSVGEDMTRTDTQLADIHVASGVDDGVVQPRSDAEANMTVDMGMQSMSDVEVYADADATTFVETPFFDRAWSQRIRIRIVPPSIEETVQEVPVYARINLAELPNADRLQADGDDIRFVDSTGNLIPHSFVGCGVSRDGEIAMIVIVPEIVPDDMDQFIWMYFGNATATASELRVWKETDLAMLHVCGDAEQSQLFDSTQSNNSGVLNSGFIDRRDSLWGNSVKVRPSMGGVHIPTLSGGSFTFDAFTLSFSIQFSGVERESLILGSANPRNNRPEYRLLHLGNGTCRFEGVGLQFIVPDPVEFPCPHDASMHHYTLLVNGSEAAMIIDGVVFDVQLPPVVFGIEQGFEPTRQMLTFLQDASGFLDEVMFSSTQMSNAWVIVRQASLMDTLLRVEY